MAIWERYGAQTAPSPYLTVVRERMERANRVRNGNAAQEGDCTKARAAHLSPRQANRTGVSTTSRDRRRLARRPCSCCPARHPARILVLWWSAQDAAAEPYEYALDCTSDRKAYAWPPLPRTPHPRLTRWQRAFYHPFLWRTLCYGKRWIVRAGKRKGAGASARAA